MSFSGIARQKRNHSRRPSGSILQKAIRQVLPDIRKIRRCSVEDLEPRRLLSTAVWTGAIGDNNWATAGNWTGGSGTGGAPAAGDSVSIGSGFTTINIPSGTVSLASITSASPLNLSNGTMTVGAGGATLSDGFTIAGGEADFNGTTSIINYSQTAGTLGGSGGVSLSGTSSWTGGTMNGTGTTVIPAAAALSLLGNPNGQDSMLRSFTNNGAITWTENAGDTNEYLFMGGNFQNNGSFTATTSSANGNLNVNHSSGTNSFTNASGATLTINGPGEMAFNSETFNSAGSAVVNSGQLIIGGGGAETGTFSGAGAVTVSNTTTSLTGVTIASLNLISGEADFDGTSSIASLNQSAGTLGGTGSLLLTGVSSWTGGTTNGTGTTTIASTGTLNLLGLPGQVVMSRTMINNGSVSWTENSSDINEYFYLAGSFQNFGTFTATSHASGNLNMNFDGGTPSFTNESGATFNANGAGNEVVSSSLPFNNDATVNVNGAELVLNGGGTQVSGSFVLTPTSTLTLGGTVSFDVNTTITGGGTVQVTGGVSTFNSMSLGGAMGLSGGEADFNGTSSVGAYNQTGGTLGGTGSLSLNGVSSWTSGQMNGTGTTVVAGGASMNLLGNNGGSIALSRTLINNGVTQWTESSSDTNEYFYISSAIQNYGTFTATAHSGGNENVQNNGGTPSFTNESTGTFSSPGAGAVLFNNVPFNNAGSTNVAGGTIDLYGGGTQTAPFAVSSGTTLGLEGTHSFTASSGITGAGTVAVINGTSTFNSATISGTLTLSGGEADFNGTTSIGSLNETGGTLGGTGSVTINGNSSWTSGTMNGTGTTTLATNATLTLLGVNSGSVVISRTFINNGTIFWTEAAADNNEYLYLSASFENFGTFSATPHANGNLNFQNNGGTPSFTNESGATFAMNGPGNFVMNAGIPFNNAGIASVIGGELDLHGGGTQTTAFSTAPGTTLDLQGTHTFASTSGVSGSGTVSVSSGTTTFNGVAISGLLDLTNGTANFNSAASSIGSLNQSGGTLGGAANVTINGNSNWTAGTMNGAGSTIIAPGVTLTLLGNTNGSAVLSRTLVNNGTISWSEAAADTNEYFYLGSALQNFGTVTFTAHAGGNLNFQNNGGTPGFINESAGTVTAAGAGKVNFNSVAFNNAGSATVNAGQLSLDGGGSQTSGFTGLPGATLEFGGAHTFTAAATITGNVNVQVDNGTADFLASLTTTGTIQFNGGTWSIEGSVSAAQLNLPGGILNLNGSSTFTLNQDGGTLGGSGTTTLEGVSSWTAGTMNGTGVTVIDSTATLNLMGNSNGSDIMSRTLINSGTVTWTENASDANEYLYLAGSFENFGSFTATAHASGNLNLNNNGGDPSIINESGGTFTLNGAGHFQVNPGLPFSNAASVNVNGGQLILDGGGTQTGTYALASGATLALAGTHNFTVASAVTGSGDVSVNGGTTTFNGQSLAGTLNLLSGEVDFNAASSVGALNQTGGTLGGTGTVTLDGNSSWAAGSMTGTGATIVAPGVAMTLVGTANGSIVMSRTFINQGMMSWTEAAADSNEYLYLNGPFQNYGTFTLTSHSGGFLNFYNNGTSPSVTNEVGGSLNVSGGGNVQVISGVTFNNLGTMTLQGGLLNLIGPVSNLTSNTTVLNGGNWILQSGEVRFSNATNISITTDAANITLDGPGAKFTQANTTGNAIAALNHIAAGGSLTLADGLDLAITPAATLTNDGTIGLGVGSTLSITGSFAQNTGGILNVQLASVGNFGQVSVTGAATLGGTLEATLASGYSLSPADSLPVLVANSPAGTFSAFAAPPSPAPPLNLNYTTGAVDIVVGSATLTISPPTLPHATAGVGYTPSLSASGGTGSGYTFAVTAGALPNGIQLSAGGLFSGNSTVAGSYSFTVTASDPSGDQGVQAYVLTVDPAAINSLVIGGLSPTQTAGTTQNFTVTAEDAFGNTITADNDTLNFTITDPHVSAPNGSLISGTGSFSETLRTAGNQTLTVKDGAVTASANITVDPAAAVGLQFTGLPTTVTAGVSHLLTVSAIDNFGNIVTSNGDTVSITSNDAAAQIPTSVQLNNGTATFNATLESTGTRVITVRDGSFAASQQTSVNPAGVSQLVIGPLTGPATAGSPETFTVTAEDSFGNIVGGDNDALVFSSPNDGLAILPGGSLSNGQGTFSVTFKRAGNDTISVSDGGISGSQSTIISAAAASTLTITGLPGSQIAGASENFTVTAYDPFGNLATGDNDTLSFSSSDPLAQLPSGALATGSGSFGVTLKTAGLQSLTVHDGAISQSQNVQVFAAGVNNLVLSPLPGTVQAGIAQGFTVTARDVFGNTMTSDNDPLGFSSSDSAATLPAGSLANGIGTFSVTFKTAGARSITVNDNGVTQSDNTTVSAGPADHLSINFSSNSPNAGAHDFTIVTAFDQFGNVASGDNDLLSLSSSDPRAVIPSVKLTNGVVSFDVTFISAGIQTMTAIDQSISKSQSVNVVPGPVQSLTVTGLPPAVVAGTAHNFSVQAYDAYGNFATGDNDALTFVSSDTNATLPIGSLVNGSGTFAATFRTAGSQSINASDGAITGSGDATMVQAAAPFSMTLTSLPSQVTAGAPAGIGVTLFDQFGNVATSDNDPLSLTSSDPKAVFSPTNLINGTGTVGVTFKTAGPQSVTVHDQSISSTDSTMVIAAAATSLSISNLNASPTAGASDGFTVTAYDTFGNVATSDNDSLSFTSSDPQASLPTAVLSGGIGTFSVAFKTGGNQSITVHDGVLGATGAVTVSPGPVASLSIAGLPASSSAGTSLPFAVTAFDAFGNVVTADNHTLTFSSSDGLAVLPSGGLTNGTGSFAVTFNSAGPQTLTVGDGSISQTVHVAVAASVIDHLGITVSNSSPTAGQGITFTVTAYDAHGNVALGDNDALAFASSDGQAVLPTGALADGSASFAATFKTAGTDSLIVTDGSVSVSTNFNVVPGAVASLVVSGLPLTVIAGTAPVFTVTAHDAFGNIAAGDDDTLSFQSSDANATLPTGSLVNGTGNFAAILRTAGVQSLNATDDGIVGTGDSTTVIAAAPSNMILTPLPTQITAGTTHSFNVTVFDSFGNLATNDNDALFLNISDPQGLWSASALNGGQGSVSVTFKTSGLQSVTVKDQAISATDTTTVLGASAVRIQILNLNSVETAGVAGSFTVTAFDQFNNIATSDNDTLAISSSDPRAVVPTGALSNGTSTFNIVFTTAGIQGVVVIAENAPIHMEAGADTDVLPGPAASLTISNLPSTNKVGQPNNFFVTVDDAYGNKVTTDNDTLTFTSSDPAAVLPPANSALSEGSGQFAVTFNTPLTQSITVTDGGVSQTATEYITAYPPSTPSTPVLDPSSDSGTKGDNATNVNTPLLTGTADPGSTVVIYDSDAFLGSVVATAGGTYAFTPSTPLFNGLHHITAQADNSGGASAMSAPLLLTIETEPPVVQAVVINDGRIQRSMVDSITVSFSEAITFDPSAFELDVVNPTTGVATPVAATITPTLSADGLHVTLTFSGSGIINHSLADGNYILTVHGSGVQDAAGDAMVSDSVTRFHRLFGDVDGDGHVTAGDLLAWRAALNQTSSSSHYVWYLDYDGSDVIDSIDYNQAISRYLSRASYLY